MERPGPGQSPPLHVFRETARTRAAYHLVEPPHRIKVNQNENPHDLPEAIKAEITRRFARLPWNRYPPFVPAAFHDRLGRHYGVPGDRVIAGNGSNELLYATFVTTLEPGDVVVVPVPTFTLYGILGGLLGARVETLELPHPFRPDVEGLLRRAVDTRAKLTLICSPNNPTGTAFSRDEVVAVLQRAPGLVLLDHAYVEFADEDLTELTMDWPNLLVFRTFSKALSLASLRVGCVIGHPEALALIDKGKLPYALDRFSMTAVETLLDHTDLIDDTVSTILGDRGRLLSALRTTAGVTPIDSQANFVLARFEAGARAGYEAFLQEGILVRDVSHYPGLEGHLRLSVGTPGETDAMIAALPLAASSGD